MLKGVIHLHSTYSDGERTLKELRQQFSRAGCSFACITDHAEAFDADSLRCYIAECREYSDEKFLFIPGLEYECERRMHILGLGMLALLRTRDPVNVIQEIEKRHCVSVIAHPSDALFDWIESLEVLPRGIEVWNTKYDGQYAPRPGTFNLLARLQERQPKLLAFYGQDLHWKRQYSKMFSWVWTDTLDRTAILQSLLSAQYHAASDRYQLPSDGALDQSQLAQFEVLQERSRWVRKCVETANKVVRRTGVKVPQSIKARVRGIF